MQKVVGSSPIIRFETSVDDDGFSLFLLRRGVVQPPAASLLATGRTIGDDRVVPNCYHVTSSSPQETAGHVRECVNDPDVGGQGVLRRIATDAGGRVHSLVHYGERDDADRYLLRITRCLRSKGHEVHKAEVLEDVEGFPGFDTSA
jgi:hypothetical protein